MPIIQGAVKYENVSFTQHGSLQLNKSVSIFQGAYLLGVVGQSGAGKSTLMKLLPRLYELESGQF